MNSSSADCSVYNAVSGLSYAYPFAAYTLSDPINSNYPLGSWTGFSFSVAPALPAGLSLNTTTGVISGTPTAPNTLAPAPDTFLITASNTSGQIYSTSIQILAMGGFQVNNTSWGAVDPCLGGSNPCNLQGMMAKLTTLNTDTLVTIKAGTYLTSGPLNLQMASPATLIIVGESPANTFIDGQNSFSGFEVSAASNITDLGFGNFEIRNMYKTTGSGGALYIMSGPSSLSINNCIFRGNRVVNSGYGGAISISSIPTLNIKKTQFISNQTLVASGTAYSGAIDIVSSNGSIMDSTFISNSATSTGGDAVGGAIYYSSGGGTLSISNTYFGSNSSSSSVSYSNGGAIRVISGSLYVNGSVFANNTCSASNALTNYGQGGAISSVSAGGIIDIDRSSLISNTVSGDTAQGSAIFSSSLTVIRNSTIAYNQVNGTTNGAAALFNNGNPLYLYFNTIVHNTANIPAMSAGIYTSGSVDMGANIVAGNYNSGGAQMINCDGASYTSDGYNISDTQVACNLGLPTDRQFSLANINLSNTFSNPFPVLALLSNSPAINYIPNGLTLGTTYTARCGVGPFGHIDARGFSRGSGTGSLANCDIGAYEYQ